MADDPAAASIRNIGFIAHIDAGKTTTTERVLFITGKTYKIGEVDAGTTQMDFLVQERERGITIQSAVTTTRWRDCQINIIDTPGHVDFTLEVEKAIKVLDGLIVIFDGVAGVQPQSETVWHQAEKFHVPRICFANKLDRAGADFNFVLEDIKRKFGVKPVAINIPYYKDDMLRGVIDLFFERLLLWKEGESTDFDTLDIPPSEAAEAASGKKALLEAVCEHDEELLALYLEGKEIPYDKFKVTLRKLVLSRELVPVFAGASLKNVGVQPLLDGICDFLPSPKDISAITGMDPRENAKVLINPNTHREFLGYVFKITRDPFLDKLTFIRIYTGSLKRGQTIYNDVSDKKERIMKIFLMHADSKTEIDSAQAGNFVGVAGLKFTRTGDTLSSLESRIVLEKIDLPKPVISLAVEPKSNKDYEKLLHVLDDFSTEDPSFNFNESKETGQLIINGMGELHLEIILDRIKRESGIELKSGEPRVTYRESISSRSENIDGVFQNDMGTASVIIDIEPLGNLDANEVELKMKGHMDRLPRNFVSEIKETANALMSVGVLKGYPLLGVKLRIRELIAQNDNYNLMLFKIALSNAFTKAVHSASPVILEPYMKFDLYTPEEYFGDAFQSLNAKGALIADIEIRGKMKIMRGTVPLARMFKYTTELRSITQGRGYINIEFKEFKPVSEEEQSRLLSYF